MNQLNTRLRASALTLSAVTAAILVAAPSHAQTAAPVVKTENKTQNKSESKATVKDETKARAEAMAALNARYVIGPAAADDFGCRIVWQTSVLATKDSQLATIDASADSVWFGDTAGSIVRIRRDNGETVWRASTFQGIEKMFGIEYLPTDKHDNAYVVTEQGTVTLDAVTGNLIRRGRFGQLPSNRPAVFGPTLIYGTGTGLASWFQYINGYNWRSTTLGGHVLAPITVNGELALAGSTNGTVLALDSKSAGIRWTRKLSAGVEAPIAVDNDTCFVASIDQSLWAFDLMRGRVVWQYFTQSALRNPPVRIADGLYLQIPGEGLVSFNPLPTDKPEGEVRWKSKAPGNIIARMGTNVLAWDEPTKTLSAVAVDNGRIVHQATFPKVAQIKFSPIIDGEAFVASTDGTVERLEPLSRKSAPVSVTNAAPDAVAGSSVPPSADSPR